MGLAHYFFVDEVIAHLYRLLLLRLVFVLSLCPLSFDLSELIPPFRSQSLSSSFVKSIFLVLIEEAPSSKAKDLKVSNYLPAKIDILVVHLLPKSLDSVRSNNIGARICSSVLCLPGPELSCLGIEG
ncbi:hypothetical protein V2J09_004655 [Rumex salicifolius]